MALGETAIESSSCCSGSWTRRTACTMSRARFFTRSGACFAKRAFRSPIAPAVSASIGRLSSTTLSI